MKLRDVLIDRWVLVRKEAEVLISGLQEIHKAEGILDQNIEGVVKMTALKRSTLPDKSRDLLKIDAVLVPMMQLRQVAYLAQSVELDLLSCEDLETAASELNCRHLGEPAGPQPMGGLIYGVKNWMLIIRSVQIRTKTRSIMFILDTGATVTYIYYDTARAFSIDPEAPGVQHIHANFMRNVTLDMYFFDPNGPHNELNVLGMDNMMATDCKVEVNKWQRTVTLTH